MNKRQINFIKMLEDHLTQKLSFKQMRIWLAENIKPINVLSAGIMRPGTWLEVYAYRTIRGHIDDLEDPTISRGPNLDWYWEEVERILGLLSGKHVYKKTVYWVEYPLSHKRRKDDQWMLPYLEYIEQVVQILATTSSERSNELNLPDLNLIFEPNPPSIRTGSEIMMDEMLNIIADYEELITGWEHLPEHFHSTDLTSTQLNRLEKLVKCFKGELYYSISASFKGFDKFTITVFVI